ncbi:MAG: MFS transporter, partial [Armatimonadetes bacterium]|nr:MFS transporter [Armatimonadota bacterium]
MDEQRKVFGVSKTVFTLGIVSFLTDVSSEMLIPIVPQFLKFVIGVPAFNIGIIEGIAEATASLLRVWAGYLADKSGRPKLLTVIGYGLSAVSKPFYLLASSWEHVLGIRFADRFGKGIRSAPRDVLIADTTDEANRGRAFGFHRAMDTAGATLGPLLVVLIVWLAIGHPLSGELGKSHRNIYSIIFIASAVPAVLGWLVLVAFVRERKHEPGAAKPPQLRFSSLDRRYWLFLGIVT